MRESSHSFVANNRACVVISSQLYDRRAIDSPLPTLPLLTSLQHLAYLTSTSPRIREILTLDGGLERLITVVAGCLDLAFPADPATQPRPQQATRRPRRIIPFKPFAAYANGSLGQDYVDGHALLHTYGFALQCLVNVGVRGSEQIRTRVVEAGVLSVVARILSGFLAARRREKERRQASAEPTRSITLWRDQNGQIPSNDVERMHQATTNAATVTTTAPTPISTNRNNAIIAQALEESVTVSIADFAAATAAMTASHQQASAPAQPSTLPPNAARMPLLPIHRTNTPDTVASIDEADQQSEQDNDAESSGQENENEQMDTEEESGVASHTSSRRRRGTVVPKLDTLTIHRHHHLHRAGSSSAPSPTASDITPSAPTPATGEVDQDGDVVMDAAQQQHQQQTGYFDTSATPRGRNTLLPHNSISAVPLQQHQSTPSQQQQQQSQEVAQTPLASTASQPLPSDYHFKEDDVLHCLHLLAYLSKYPHVRAVFHDPENETCRPPPSSPSTSTTNLPACCSGQQNCSRKKQRCGDNGEACSSTCSENHAHDQDVMNDDEDECTGGRDAQPTASTSRCPHTHSPSHSHSHSHSQPQASTSTSQSMDEDDDDQDLARAKAMASLPAKDRKPAAEPSRPPRSTANNVFSLVEQFTFRPSSASDRSMGPRLPTEIQYWAGVIMRNACRKDEVRGGIRQCANMGCGVWERFPREFAKCRRCRKAKYCSKSCQKRAWQAGHRYWCSARVDSPPQQPSVSNAVASAADNVAVQIATNAAAPDVLDNSNTTEIRVLEDMQ